MRSVFKLLRISLAPTAVSNSVAGVLLAQGSPHVSALAFAAGFSVCAYSLGMVLNDIADLERDRTLHPDRPLVRGEISLVGAWAIALVLAAGAMGFAVALGEGAFGLGGLLVLVVFAYDFALKRLGILGAFAMGAARGLNFLVGFATVESGKGHPYALVLFCYVTAVTCISLLEDDPKRGCFAACSVAAAVAAGCVGYFAVLSKGWLGVGLSAAVIFAWLSQAVVRFRSFDRAAAMRGVFYGLILIVPLDAAIVAADPSKAGSALLLLLLLPLAGVLRRFVYGRVPE